MYLYFTCYSIELHWKKLFAIRSYIIFYYFYYFINILLFLNIFREGFLLIFSVNEVLIYKYPLFGVSGHWIDLVLRCIFGTISISGLYLSFRLIPLSDATTIYSSTPIFVILFAYFILKEPITILQVVTETIVIIGAVIIMQ